MSDLHTVSTKPVARQNEGLFISAVSGCLGLAGSTLLASASLKVLNDAVSSASVTQTAGILLKRHIDLGFLSDFDQATINQYIEMAGLTPVFTIADGAVLLSTVAAATLGYVYGSKPAQSIIHIDGPEFIDNPYKASERLRNTEAGLVKESGVAVHIGGVPISNETMSKGLVIPGRTGGGKGVALNPIIQEAIDNGDRIIMFDNKPDFTEWVKCKNGEPATLLAPWDARTARYDVGKDCQTKAAAQELAAQIIRDSSDPMWSAGARQILTGAIMYCITHYHEKWTYRHLSKILTETKIDDWEDLLQKYYPEGVGAVEKLQKADGKPEASKTTQSLLISLKAEIGVIHQLADAFDGVEETWSISDFLNDKTPQVAIMQGNQIYRNLQQMFTQTIVNPLCNYINSPQFPERPFTDRATWLIFDEFPQMGDVRRIIEVMAITRSKNIKTVTAFQDVSQLYETYGQNLGNSILSVLQNFIFAGLGKETMEWASATIGDRVVDRWEQQGVGDNAHGSYRRETARAVPAASLKSSRILGRKTVMYKNRLGLHMKPRAGIQSIFYGGGDEPGVLHFPFMDKQKYREPSIPAEWTKPEHLRGQAETEEKPAAPVKLEKPEKVSTDTKKAPKPAKKTTEKPAVVKEKAKPVKGDVKTEPQAKTQTAKPVVKKTVKAKNKPNEKGVKFRAEIDAILSDF